MWSLTVCGERNRRPAISRFVAPAATSSRTSRSRSVRRLRVALLSGSNRVIPRPTIRAALAISRAPRRLETNPDTPAARAVRDEMRSPADMRSTRVAGDACFSRA